VVPSRGAKPTSLRNRWSKPPTKPFPSENASEKPTAAQATVTTASAPTLIMKVFSVFFERTRPA
jgi:hypothetical protein